LARRDSGPKGDGSPMPPAIPTGAWARKIHRRFGHVDEQGLEVIEAHYLFWPRLRRHRDRFIPSPESIHPLDGGELADSSVLRPARLARYEIAVALLPQLAGAACPPPGAASISPPVGQLSFKGTRPEQNFTPHWPLRLRRRPPAAAPLPAVMNAATSRLFRPVPRRSAVTSSIIRA